MKELVLNKFIELIQQNNDMARRIVELNEVEYKLKQKLKRCEHLCQSLHDSKKTK